MYKGFVSILFSMVFSTVIISATYAEGDLASYEPKSPAEAEIKKCLMDFENAIKNEDLDGVMACFHENVKYQTARSGWASKKELPKNYEWFWAERYTIKFGTPDITINGNEAVVRIPTEWESNNGAGLTLNIYTLVREGDSWLIIKRTRQR